jgi:hypothetical protein
MNGRSFTKDSGQDGVSRTDTRRFGGCLFLSGKGDAIREPQGFRAAGLHDMSFSACTNTRMDFF